MKLSSSCVSCFSGLAANARVEIINLLQKENQLSVLEIVKHFRLTQPTITHHLHYLEQAGILASQRKGRQVFYFLKPRCQRKECYVFR